jgi:hypothetical protein
LLPFANEISFARLDEDSRQSLIALLELRNALNTQLNKCNRLMIAHLDTPTEQSQAEIDTFMEEVIKPLREQMKPFERELMLTAFDLEKLQAFLPMLLAGVMQSIDFELFFCTGDIDPDKASFFFDKLQAFLNRGNGESE